MYIKFIRVSKIFRSQVFAGFAVFSFAVKITISKMRNLCSSLLFHENLLISTLLTRVFILINGIVFNRLNGLVIKCLIACLMN